MSVLRNRVGARTHAELRDAENDLVEARVIELREDPNLLGDRTDLAYLRAIHRQLFQPSMALLYPDSDNAVVAAISGGQ